MRIFYLQDGEILSNFYDNILNLEAFYLEMDDIYGDWFETYEEAKIWLKS